MEIQYIKEFIKIAETSNYLEASAELYISQSSLSKHIQSLEKELGVSLFDRTTRKVTLTKYGEIFLEYANKIIELNDSCLIDIEKAQDSINSVFSLGVIPAVDSNNISIPLKEFKKNTHGYKFKVEEYDTSDLIEMLKEEKCSMVICYETKELLDPKYVRINFTSDYLVAVLPKTNELAKYNPLPITKLKDKNLMVLQFHSILLSNTKKMCKDAGFEPNFNFTHKRFLSNYELTSEDLIAIFFNNDATYVNNPSNAILEIEPKVKVNLSLVYLKSHKLTDAEKYFINILKECKQKEAYVVH